MSVLRWLFLPVMVVAFGIVVRQHIDYLRHRRPFTFRAFLQTAGWLVITLAAVAAFGGGLESTGTRMAEISAFAIGGLFVAIGTHIKPAIESK
jgi:hypothetical protein